MNSPKWHGRSQTEDRSPDPRIKAGFPKIKWVPPNWVELDLYLRIDSPFWPKRFKGKEFSNANRGYRE